MHYNKVSRIKNDPSLLNKILKLQAILRGRLIRKKYGIKDNYKFKETNASIFNFKDTYSDNRSINIGSDIINGAGLSNGGSTKHHNQKIINLKRNFNRINEETRDKTKMSIQNIVRI